MRRPNLTTAAGVWLALALAATAAHAGPLEDGVAAFKDGDYATAHRLLRPLADRGNVVAEASIGTMYVFSEGAPPDLFNAGMGLLHKAADRGDALAQYELGFVYDETYPRGPTDPALAAAWYRKAAAHGRAQDGAAEAELRLAQLYQAGKGVGRDPKAAAGLFRAAAAGFRWRANRGDLGATMQLAGMYEQGKVISADPREAERLLTEAASRLLKAAWDGDPFAQVQLADFYRFGNGVPRDEVRTMLWLRRAADQGDGQAQLSLGSLYLGSPTAPPDAEDKIETLVWLTLAARSRSWLDASLATNLSAGVAKLLSPEQQAEAARRIDAWRPAPEPRSAAPQVAGDDALSIAVTPGQRAEAARLWAKWRPLSPQEMQAALTAAHAYDMSLGSSRAKVTVVEYATIGSPAAARFNNEVLPRFKAR